VILATVGTQLPFPRLIQALDQLAPRLGEEVIAQTGKPDPGLRHVVQHDNLPPRQFDELFQTARTVVAHAGIGTVLAARKYRKPLILFPRRAAFGEHRNDHQIATAEQLAGRPGIHVAWTAEELEALLLNRDLAAPQADAVSPELEQLHNTLRGFLRQQAR
jgi:UDP-N-acetylglucosamine transferase subunit ALG13